MTSTGKWLDAIAKERAKQIDHWTSEHDDRHRNGELAAAACHHASPRIIRPEWPFDEPAKQYESRTRELVVAAAFIVAELERRDRLSDPDLTAYANEAVKWPQPGVRE